MVSTLTAGLEMAASVSVQLIYNVIKSVMTRKMKIIAGSLAVAVVAATAWAGLGGLTAGAEYVDEEENADKADPVGPLFNADSAYAFVRAQCDFGPRVMNSAAHDRCGDWIRSAFARYGCQVSVQEADLKGYDGTMLKSRNIIARWRPESEDRVLLCAHWDSRPWADNDPDSTNHHKPIIAANDGASGVGVMLEIARLLSLDNTLKIGVDFVCFDAEDWGAPQWADAAGADDSWALGSRYFASNLPASFSVRYGILLDMVGGRGAAFYQEGISKQYAPDVVKKVWRASRQAGYGSFFPRQEGGMVTDDHVPLNEIARIPTVDIIPYFPSCLQSSFGPTWHTLADNMDNIDPATLKAVGQTLIQVLYTEE